MLFKVQATIRADLRHAFPYPDCPLMNDNDLRKMDGIFTTPIEHIEADSLDSAKNILLDKYQNNVKGVTQSPEWLYEEPV